MPNLTISIPHQLGREEAKRRIQEQASQLLGQQGGLLERVEQRWEGDTLHFHVGAVGQSVTGSAHFTEQNVLLEIALPWMLSLLAGTMKKQIEERGHKLLGQQPTT
jgi:putative polyhydroxyalkanoate system protein